MEKTVRSCLTLFALMMVAPAPASAEVTRVLLPNGQKVTLDAVYRKNNEIRVFGSASSIVFPTEVMRAAVVRMAELASARDMPRFAVVKISDCGQLKMYGSAVNSQCRLLGQMLREGEAARPEGKREVTIFRTADVVGGRLMPEADAANGF